METFVTCAVLVTTESQAWAAGAALQVDLPVGVAVREDPHVPEVFYLEAAVTAASADQALEQTAKAAATVAVTVGLGLAVEELVVIGVGGSTHWAADETVGTHPG